MTNDQWPIPNDQFSGCQGPSDWSLLIGHCKLVISATSGGLLTLFRARI